MGSLTHISTVDPQELTARISQWTNHRHLPQSTHPALTCPDSSPVSSLPPELLIEIFKLTLPEERYPCPSPTAAPLSLVHVCRYWRQLAKATPDLWSSIHLNYRSAVEDVSPTRLWLSCSGDKPLSLSLSIDFDQAPHQAIIDVLAEHSKRWKHVRFEFQNLQCPQVYELDLAMSNVPLLSSFEFHARDISTSNIQPISSLLATAPNLKELSWVDDLADAETLLSLPLPRLSRLSLSMNYGSLDYLKLLNQCSNLEHIRITRPFPEIRPPQPPLVLTKLTSLNIAHDLTGILDHLILPSLKRVRVHMDSGVTGHMNGRYSRALAGMPSPSGACAFPKVFWNPTSLLNLVERSSCTIETLWIHAPMAEDDLAKCLTALSPSLKSLTMSGGLTLTDTIIQSLVPRRSMSTPSLLSEEDRVGEWECLCPCLAELKLDSPIPTACSLVDMVQARLDLPRQVPHLSSTSGSRPDVRSPNPVPLQQLKVQYHMGHRDIPYLREFARVINSSGRNSFDLSIVELRTGTTRGSSAGRTRTLMYRGKASASR